MLRVTIFLPAYFTNFSGPLKQSSFHFPNRLLLKRKEKHCPLSNFLSFLFNHICFMELMSKNDSFLVFVNVLSVEAVWPSEYELIILDVSRCTQTKTKRLCFHHISIFNSGFHTWLSLLFSSNRNGDLEQNITLLLWFTSKEEEDGPWPSANYRTIQQVITKLLTV